MNRLGEWGRRIWHLLNRRRFEDALRPREEARDVWGWTPIDALARDVRFAVRALRRTPSFTLVGVMSLAIGLALAAAAVAVMNAYSIAALPYPAADRLYRVSYAPPGPWEPRGLSGLDWASVADVVEFPITTQSETFYSADRSFARPARGLRVNRGFLEGLGVRTVLGRSLDDADFRAASERAVLVGHALWRDGYGADPAVIGRTIRVEPETTGGAIETFRIAGVLAPGFYFGRDSGEVVDLLVPLSSSARTYMVRLHEGVPSDLAERRLTEGVRRVSPDLPGDWRGVRLTSVYDLYVAEVRPVLGGVMAAAAIVLLIVGANLAVLVVLRVMRRQKEMAVRAALGCSRRDLARMLLIEAGVLCGLGLGIGLALGALALRALAPLIELQLGRSAPGGAGAIAVDATVLVVVGGIGLAIAAVLACLPLIVPGQHRLGGVLRTAGTAGVDGRWPRRLRSTLIAIEVAGALMLLVSCGLMTRSVIAMLRTDLGFDQERLVRTRVVLRGTDYADRTAFTGFYEPFSRRLAAETGSRVVFTNWPPFFEYPTQLVEAEGRPDVRPAGAIAVGAEYFTTLGIAIRSGRDFTADDMRGVEPVAVVSETLARQLWPDGGAVGRYIRSTEETPEGPRRREPRRVVGVAADVRQTYGDTDVRDIYQPLVPRSYGRFGSFYMRTDHSPASLWSTMRQLAADLDPHATIHQPRPVESEDRQVAGTRVLTGLLTAFAAIAGFLALLGIHGVTAYAVQQRERELAIRMAVGATRRAVVSLFLKESGLVLGIGLIAGLCGAVASARVLEHQLYAVPAIDIPTLAVTTALLGTAGLLAVWWPARRAASRSPVTVLKEG